MQIKNDKQMRNLISILLILVLFCVFQFVYRPLQNKTKALQEENEVYEQRLAELQAKAAKEDQYQKDTDEYKAKLKEIKEKYGAGNTPQKSTKFIITMCDFTGMTVPTLSFSEDTCIYNSLNPDTGLYLYRNTLTFTYQASYNGLKKCLDYINTYPEYMNVNSLTASFDAETGNLSGVIELNQFSMSGTGTEYEEPTLNDVMIGKDNIFGSGSN